MKKCNLYLLLIVALFAPISHAATLWNVEGNWNLDGFVQNGLVGQYFNVSSENFNTGVFSGTDSSGNTLSGNTDNNSITFDFYTDNGSYLRYILQGTIAADGTLSGGLTSNIPDHGTWGGWFWTVSGAATPSVPIPASIWLVVSALAGLVGLGRRKRQI